MEFKKDGSVRGSEDPSWHLWDHSSKCGFRSKNTKKVANRRWTENALETYLHIICAYFMYIKDSIKIFDSSLDREHSSF